MRGIIITISAALILTTSATAAGACQTPSFKNRTAFQSYIAGSIGIRSVKCVKLNARVAECLGSNRRQYVVACKTASGKGCSWMRVGL